MVARRAVDQAPAVHGVGIDVVGFDGCQHAGSRSARCRCRLRATAASCSRAGGTMTMRSSAGRPKPSSEGSGGGPRELAHIDPDQAAAARPPCRPCALTLVLKRWSGGNVGHVEAVAFDVELPAVIGAADAAFFVAAEEHGGAAMRAAMIQDADTARSCHGRRHPTHSSRRRRRRDVAQASQEGARRRRLCRLAARRGVPRDAALDLPEPERQRYVPTKKTPTETGLLDCIGLLDGKLPKLADLRKAPLAEPQIH